MAKGKARRLGSRGREAGQGATEYMLVIGVVVIALIAAAYTFVPQFKSGVQELAVDVKVMLSDHKVLGIASSSTGINGNQNGSTTVPGSSSSTTTSTGSSASSSAPNTGVSNAQCQALGACDSTQVAEGTGFGF